jgi:hypothetical protein
MTDTKKVALTAAEIRAQIAAAEQAHLAATLALGEALVVKAALPDRDVSREQAAVGAARQRADQLRAMLPILEKAEAAALEETRARLAAEQRKKLEKELQRLLREALSFATHQANAVSAWKRLVAAGEAASKLLFDNQRPQRPFPRGVECGRPKTTGRPRDK